MPTNLPTKKSGVRVECRTNNEAECKEFLTSEGWMIDRCDTDYSLARLVEWARDEGYRHAMTDVRNLIGAK
jgi:hypothetical protein